MAVMSIKRNSFLSRFKNFLPSQNLYHKVGNKPRFYSDNDSTVQTLGLHPIGHPFEGHCRLLTSGPRRINGGPGARKLDRRKKDWRKKDSVFEPGEINVSKWKKMDSRSLGITRTMVPSSPFTVLKILRTRGFEAYLVGGCVRDLLLKRTPRDFDVITTADLHQIRKQFHNCHIVGRKFPICRVHIKGSVIEVSSFKTSAKHSEDKEKFLVSQVPRGCDKSDLNLWKNCMHRDFTVNSLFFDPVIHKIYDYSNGMKDLLELKLRTLVPAHLSFTEDCARILRGLRIAARLGLSFSKDTETAIHKQASSILSLSESRIMMEIDLMLSFGASESSLRLLHRFHILEILLPFQAAYINKQASGSGECTMMLMKLFSHMDKFITCDRPAACRLWIGLLAFHQALLDKPQDPFVVLTFASVLYHQEWQGGLQFARQCGRAPASFEPELSDPCGFISDDELSVKVRQLALQVLDSIEVLVETDSMHKKMSKFPGFPCSGLIFIPKKSACDAAELFHVLAHKMETYNKGRSSFEMNYHLLGKGDASETRFAVGKIILNTMGCGIDQDDDDNHPSPSRAEKGYFMPSNSRLQQPNTYNHKKQQPITKLSSNKKQYSVTEKKSEDGSFLELEQQKEVVFKQHIEALCDYSCPKMEDGKVYKPEISMPQSPMRNLIGMLETIIDETKSPSELESPKKLEERIEGNTLIELDQAIAEHQRERNKPGGSLFWCVQTNCNRAIEEAKDSPADMRKLNEFLDRFVDEQVQRKKAKKQLEAYDMVSSIHTFQPEASSLVSSIGGQKIESEQLEASSLVSSIGVQKIESEQLEESSLVASSIVTSEMENRPQKSMQHSEETKTKWRSKKAKSSGELSMNDERKKQRVCSYCKETGHNRTGCPKRKMEESILQG